MLPASTQHACLKDCLIPLHQGISVEHLMADFDSIQREIEKIPAYVFNDDHIYKERLNEVNDPKSWQITMSDELHTL